MTPPILGPHARLALRGLRCARSTPKYRGVDQNGFYLPYIERAPPETIAISDTSDPEMPGVGASPAPAAMPMWTRWGTPPEFWSRSPRCRPPRLLPWVGLRGPKIPGFGTYLEPRPPKPKNDRPTQADRPTIFGGLRRSINRETAGSKFAQPCNC